MIPFETCIAIREVVQLLVDIRKYWMGMKYQLKFSDDMLDSSFGNHSVVFDYGHEVYINRITPSTHDIISISSNGTVHSMYLAYHPTGWRIEMGDYEGSTYDNFGLYDNTINSIVPHDLLIMDAPSTEEDYESALFQLSTIYDPQVASVLLVNLFVRDILHGTGSKISTSSVLYQLSPAEIRTAKKLLEEQFCKLRSLEIE